MDSMDKLPTQEACFRLAAREAIDRLGLLRPEAVSTIERMLLEPTGAHPKAVCTAYRKVGIQLGSAEKRELGIRSNGFMSRMALAELSEKGRESPLKAHETTLLRAFFTVSRYRSASSIWRMRQDHPDWPMTLTYEVIHNDPCEYCRSRDGTVVRSDWDILPSVDCECATAPYGIRQHVEFDHFALTEVSPPRRGRGFWQKLRKLLRLRRY